MLPQSNSFTNCKGVSNNASHFPLRGNGIMKGMAEAVALASASHPIFDEAVLESDGCGGVHKNTRRTVWHVIPPSRHGQFATFANDFKPMLVKDGLP